MGDSELIKCWCGAEGTFDELFNQHVFSYDCGGLGILNCECGGCGLCVCHNHGEVECPGCPMCQDEDEHDHDYLEEFCE